MRRLMFHVSCTWPLLPWAHQPPQTLLAATPVQHAETTNSMNINFMQRLSSPPSLLHAPIHPSEHVPP